MLARGSAGTESELPVTVKPSEFQAVVTTAGELNAPKVTEISLSSGLQQAELHQLKITSLVPEGTVVQQGDTVATLDQASYFERLTEVTLGMQKAQAVYEQAALDSTLNLSKERDNLRSLELALEEKKLAEQQVIYEAPAIKRQAALDLERATRALDQAKSDYRTRVQQAEAKMREVGADLARYQNWLNSIEKVKDDFTIRAPGPGMIVYKKVWRGEKRVVGSQVAPWDPVVAVMPDLSAMESISYVNEIDIRKIAVGQPVRIRLDADPAKVLRGRVARVASGGEQRPNTDAKVFEVGIAIETTDTTLRPGMTTSNTIEVRRLPGVLAVPIEALSNQKGIPFVYKRASRHVVKQEVVAGAINDDAVVIVRGLVEGDRVLLSPPKNADKAPLVRLPAEVKRSVPAK